MTADLGTTSFVSGLAIYLAATFSLLVALRLHHTSYVSASACRVIAAGYALLGIALMISHGLRAMDPPRTAGEILGVLAGATFVLASVFAFRGGRAKSKVL